MPKAKVHYERKLEAVMKYNRGEGSLHSIASEYNVHVSGLKNWVDIYESIGPSALIGNKINRYTAEQKTTVVEAYLRGEGSQREICKKYRILSTRTLRDWIKVYTGHREFRATGGRERGITMTKGRTTTLEERIEIVSYCIASGKDYAATIEKYGVSYNQIYSWVAKYEEKGKDGLSDKRGKRKQLDDMSELERLKAENKRLKAEKEDKELEILVLKKLQEIERRRR
jgi:transposase